MLCRKLNFGPHKPDLVDMAIRLGLDRSNFGRELISKLLASLCRCVRLCMWDA